MNHDAQMLAQECMCHLCNEYCLGCDDKNKPRECKFGYGKETECGKCDTEGKPLQETSVILCGKRGVEQLLLKRTKSRKVVQHSTSCLQCWRANVDVQLLVYRTHPNKPNMNEIENVIKYVVAYASKKNHTSKAERSAIQDIITW
jgi:hypothetical protein